MGYYGDEGWNANRRTFLTKSLEEQQTFIVNLRNKGATLAMIAYECGVSISAVYPRLNPKYTLVKLRSQYNGGKP